MRRLAIAAAVFALVFAAGLATAGAARADEWWQDEDVVMRQAWHRGAFDKLKVKFPVGTLEVVGTESDSILLIVVPHCELGSPEACEKAVRRIHVRERKHGKTLELAVVGHKLFDTSRVQVEARLEVPRELALELGMRVGELEVTGLTSDAKLELGVGEATVRTAERSFKKASVDVGIGESMLVKHGRSRARAGMFANSIQWERGTGPAALGLHVGIGEASVYLD